MQKREKLMQVIVTNAQYRALSAIYGPPENVHCLIMCSRPVDGKWVLDGKGEVFDELLSVISEEIGEGLCPKNNARALLSICKKIDPSSLDCIGM